MNVQLKCQILASERVTYDSGDFVKLQGFINDVGVFKMTVPEDKVPDMLEGKACTLIFGVGVDQKLKPTLRLNGISLEPFKVETEEEGINY